MTMGDTATSAEFAALAQDMATQGWHFHRDGDGPFDRFQVMGERGCGTNVVRKSITKTLQIARTECLGWKHGVPIMVGLPPSFLTVCVVRNARSWATSLFKRPWHAEVSLQNLDFRDFLRTPWQGEIDNMNHFEVVHPELKPLGQELQWDRHPITGRRFANIFEMRNVKHRGLLSFLDRGCSVAYVTLERFNADPVAFLHALGEAYGLAHTPRGYRPITRRMGNQWRASVDRAPAPDTWDAADVDWMNTQISPELEQVFGLPYPA